MSNGVYGLATFSAKGAGPTPTPAVRCDPNADPSLVAWLAGAVVVMSALVRPPTLPPVGPRLCVRGMDDEVLERSLREPDAKLRD